VCFVHTSHGNSTGVANDLHDIRSYYATFVNTMSNIAKRFGARIVKNITDTLIIYFPRTSNPFDDCAFKDVIECGITMLAAGDTINSKLYDGSESIIYRISADYGKVEVAKLMTSNEEDLFGPTMNLCAKINSKAPANNMVIGGDLYLLIKSFFSQSSFKNSDYQFKELKGHSIGGFTFAYPVYSVKSKYRRNVQVSDHVASSSENKKAITGSLNFSPQTNYSNPNIMIIDDEKDVLFSFKQCLTSNGFRVETFSDSLEALKRFGQVDPDHFDLVVLDLRMPGINGIELYSKLKSMNRDVKILVVTALDVAPELASLFADLSLNEIIRKPIEMEGLINIVKNASAKNARARK